MADVPFPGETYYGPPAAPYYVITAPRLHTLAADDPYADTQCCDGIRDGDVFVIAGTDVVGMLVQAWPVCLHGDGEPYGLHTFRADMDPRWIGQEPYGRLFDVTICPLDAPRFTQTEFFAPRTGGDYRASFALAARALRA